MHRLRGRPQHRRAAKSGAVIRPPAGEAWRIKVSGLQGGHSGIDINKGRGNARAHPRARSADPAGSPAPRRRRHRRRQQAQRHPARGIRHHRNSSRSPSRKLYSRSPSWKTRSGPTSARSTPACALRSRASARPAASPGRCRRLGGRGTAGQPAPRRSGDEPRHRRPGADVHQPGHGRHQG